MSGSTTQEHRVDFQRSLLFHGTEKRTQIDSDLWLALLVFYKMSKTDLN